MPGESVRPSTTRVDLTPAQVKRIRAAGWTPGDGTMAEWLVRSAESRQREATADAHIAETDARSVARWALQMLHRADDHDRHAVRAQPLEVDGLTIPAAELARMHEEQAHELRCDARDALEGLAGGADSGAYLLLRALADRRLVLSIGRGPTTVGLCTDAGAVVHRGPASQELADAMVRALRAEVTDA